MAMGLIECQDNLRVAIANELISNRLSELMLEFFVVVQLSVDNGMYLAVVTVERLIAVRT